MREARGKTAMALSTVDARIKSIDAERSRLKFSHSKLCRNAGVELSMWYRLRQGERSPRGNTLRRLEAALAGERLSMSNADLVRKLFSLSAVVLRTLIGADIELIAACTKRTARRIGPPSAVSAQRFRRMVMYVVAVELEVDNAALARAIGTSRQNVLQARTEIHDLRDNPLVDGLFERAAAAVRETAE